MFNSPEQPSVNLDVSLGGTGAGGGDGGAVTLTNDGDILTRGGNAAAIHAQSIGGGGGRGGDSAAGGSGKPQVEVADFIAGGMGVDAKVIERGNGIYELAEKGELVWKNIQKLRKALASYEAVNPAGPAVETATSPASRLNVNIGGAYAGSGGAGGNGGTVKITNTGDIATNGPSSDGIFAQSIGGGGSAALMVGADNSAGSVESVWESDLLPTFVPVEIGGKDGAAGSAGKVAIALTGTGSIVTSGTDSYGVLAQSIDGGGGLVGGMSNIRLEQGSRAASGSLHDGQGGNITIGLAAGSAIQTSGKRAHGIFAQSAGGGGGLFSHADGSGFSIAGSGTAGCGGTCTGRVGIDIGGRVAASGAESYAIYAQSRGSGTNGIAVTNSGVIRAQGDASAAIFLDSTGPSRVENRGYIDGWTGTAIAGNSTAEIVNSGWITGAIRATGATYAITNLSGGRIYAGDTIASRSLTSAGQVWIGDHNGRVLQSRVASDFTSTGTIVADMDFAAGTADRLTVDGTANIGGTILVNPITL